MVTISPLFQCSTNLSDLLHSFRFRMAKLFFDVFRTRESYERVRCLEFQHLFESSKMAAARQNALWIDGRYDVQVYTKRNPQDPQLCPPTSKSSAGQYTYRSFLLSNVGSLPLMWSTQCANFKSFAVPKRIHPSSMILSVFGVMIDVYRSSVGGSSICSSLLLWIYQGLKEERKRYMCETQTFAGRGRCLKFWKALMLLSWDWAHWNVHRLISPYQAVLTPWTTSKWLEEWFVCLPPQSLERIASWNGHHL